jgi:hypothetical protein
MISVYTRKFLALVITLSLAAATFIPAYAEALTTTERVTEPYEDVVTACNGEDVFVSGEVLLIYQDTIDDTGGIHSQFTLVPSKVRGVGSATGTQYLAVGGDREHFNFYSDGAPLSLTNTDMYNLVSQGGTDNLQVKFTFHITINADGEITAIFDHSSEVCNG